MTTTQSAIDAVADPAGLDELLARRVLLFAAVRAMRPAMARPEAASQDAEWSDEATTSSKTGPMRSATG